jgi:hypothetical protein
MKIDKCKLFGHKWYPCYVRGYYGGTQIKFIGVYCQRCRKGHDELLDAIKKQTISVYGTHSEEYFDDPKYNPELGGKI